MRRGPSLFINAASIPPTSHVAIRPNAADGGPEILVVEDSEDDEILSIRALRKAGVSAKITTFHDGDAALAYIAKRMLAGLALPHVLLLDIKLPGRTGLQILQELRASRVLRDLPVMILTGYGAHLALPFGDHGPTVLIHKPLQPSAFRDGVRDLRIADLFRAAA